MSSIRRSSVLLARIREKIARIIAKADADLEAGRCQPMDDLLESEDRE
jgi:hypothetical protein